MKYDLLLTSLPEMEDHIPSPAPFYLKAILEEYGFNVLAIDGNRYKTVDLLEEEINKYEFTHLGISVFSFEHVEFSKELAKRFPNTPKVFGGSGVTLGWNDWFDKNTGAFIVGEGEYSLVEYMKGNLNYPGINGIPPEQIKEINHFPIPDYTDIDINKYKSVIITGSKGCVRHCAFCNVRDMWKHYIYVDGDILARNMIKLASKYNLRRVSFSDSLINGSTVEFRKMCKTLISESVKRFFWSGQFIIRKNIKDKDFDIMKRAGCSHVSIGVESGSEKVRKSMNKSFSNEAIYWNFDNLLKYKIDFKFMLIIGYITETEEDFQETLDLIEKYKLYGPRIAITPHMFLVYENKGLDADDGFKWENENSNYLIRLKRMVRVFDLMKKHNYIIEPHALKKLKIVEKQLEKYNA